MPDTLPVHVNRTSLHSLEVPDAFETAGSFDIELVNHGEPIHVHLHLEDDLSDTASLGAPNHYVDRESTRPVRVTVHRPGSAFGKLKIATAYGAKTRYVDIDLAEPTEQAESVEIDESLSKPQSNASERGAMTRSTSDRSVSLPVLGLGGVALLLAIAVASLVGGTAAWIGALVVFLAVAAALVVLVAD